jgi:hypothetical protein
MRSNTARAPRRCSIKPKGAGIVTSRLKVSRGGYFTCPIIHMSFIPSRVEFIVAECVTHIVRMHLICTDLKKFIDQLDEPCITNGVKK